MEQMEVQPPRPGEEIDVDALVEYLRGRIASPLNDAVIEQFPGGSSNLTYLLRAGTTEFVLRRPPFGNTVKSAHDMRREFDVLSKLAAVYPPAPEPILFCDDESVIGSEFYLMERRRGLIIRGRINSSLQKPAQSKGTDIPPHPINAAVLTNSQPARETVCRTFIENLAKLHSIDYEAFGLGDLGKPDGYNRRQVEGWTKRYFAAKTDEHPELESAIGWLGENIPRESGASLIHNDYKFDNVMLDPDDLSRVIAVLDWEMVTIGDPLMDLGTTLGYWMSPDAGEQMMNIPFNPRVLMENVTREQLTEMYATARGIDIPDMRFYHTFGTFKIAVIAQQIYARYVKGLTKDERFAGFNKFVGALGRIASNSIAWTSI